MTRHYVIEDAATTIAFFPPEGPADADGTINIYSSGSTLLGAFTADSTAVANTYSQSPTSGAGVGATELSITTTGLLKGQRLWITSPTGEEEAIVDSTVAGTLYLVDPLSYAATTATVVDGHALTYEVQADEAANRQRWARAVWQYAVGSVTYTHTERLDVVRYDWRTEVTPTAYDLEKQWTRFPRAASSKTYSWRRIVEGAIDEVEDAIRATGIAPDLVRDPENLKRLVVLKAIETFEGGQPAIDDASLDFWRDRYRDKLTQLLATPDWVDRDDDMIFSDGYNRTSTLGDGTVVRYRVHDLEHGPLMDEALGLTGGRRLKVG
jgi:hypothetical protein